MKYTLKQHQDTLKQHQYTFKQHPASAVFPQMARVALGSLIADIRKNGQRVPILVEGTKVIDGWHRYLACMYLKIPVKQVAWTGTGSVEDYVISLNLHRRHLNVTQRSMVMVDMNALRLARVGKKAKVISVDSQPIKPDAEVTTRRLAEQAKVSVQTIKDARRVKLRAPEIVDDVKTGKTTMREALKVVKARAPKKRKPYDDELPPIRENEKEKKQRFEDYQQGFEERVIEAQGSAEEWRPDEDYPVTAKMVKQAEDVIAAWKNLVVQLSRQLRKQK